MTSMIVLAKQLLKRIEWQNTPDDVTSSDLLDYIADGIRYLYLMTGRNDQFDESLFTYDDDGKYVSFANDLALDEHQYVLLTAQIDFYRKTQDSVDDMTSYSTDAMTVTHGDKPFANLQQRLMDLTSERNRIWHKFDRFNIL